MQTIPRASQLAPYFKIAEQAANQSPCVRRKYAALIAFDGLSVPYFVVESNSRQSRCCEGICTRDRFRLDNGQSIEKGAEIHAETAALIRAPTKHDSYFLMVGFLSNGQELYGPSVYPCHACALAIKFAGYTHIYIRQTEDNAIPVLVDEIIEYRELEWEPDV